MTSSGYFSGGGVAEDEVEDGNEHQTGAESDQQQRWGQCPGGQAVSPVDDGPPQCEQADDGDESMSVNPLAGVTVGTIYPETVARRLTSKR